MRTIDTIRRSGVAIDGGATIRDAAQLMEQSGVGALAVLDGSTVAGIVTDRDLVRRGLAKDLARPITAETIFGQRDAAVPAVR